MNLEELNQMLENNPMIEWKQDEEGFLYFRHNLFDKEDEQIKVTPEIFRCFSKEELLKAIINGRNVDHITRVTGYFSRTSGWNKGKTAELGDRWRTALN
jgi:ribonucleoside-triphosphate reductase